MQEGVTVQDWARHVNDVLAQIANTQANHSDVFWLLAILNTVVAIFIIVTYLKLSDLIAHIEAEEAEEAEVEQVNQSSPTVRRSSNPVVEPGLSIGMAANDLGTATANPSARKIGG